MSGRDPAEDGRSATPLELLLDLAFVVAVASAAAGLHHHLESGHLASGLVGYGMVFFAVWWAWVNYSWFASAYDTGDVLFRLTTFVVMTGVLVVAAGIPRAAGEEHDFGLVVAGYVIMRLALVPSWLRVAREDATHRTAALRYARGVVLVQLLWIARVFWFGEHTLGYVTFVVLMLMELSVPFVAERAGQITPWHRHHIAERYEAFTIIVLGEVILATTQGISASLDQHGASGELLLVVGGALVTVFSLWWLYFKRPMVDSVRQQTAFLFGYAHYFVFASVAAVGAALGAAIALLQHAGHEHERTVALFLAAMLSVYLLSLAAMHALAQDGSRPVPPALVVAAVMIGIGALPFPLPVTVAVLALVMAGTVAQHVSSNQPARNA